MLTDKQSFANEPPVNLSVSKPPACSDGQRFVDISSSEKDPQSGAAANVTTKTERSSPLCFLKCRDH